MKKDDLTKLQFAHRQAMEAFEKGEDWQKVWADFKRATTAISDPKYRELVRGTDSMITRKLLNTQKRMKRWIFEMCPQNEVA